MATNHQLEAVEKSMNYDSLLHFKLFIASKTRPFINKASSNCACLSDSIFSRRDQITVDNYTFYILFFWISAILSLNLTIDYAWVDHSRVALFIVLSLQLNLMFAIEKCFLPNPTIFMKQIFRNPSGKFIL